MNGRFAEIALHKGGQTYIFRFDDAGHQALLGVLARFAVAADLNFSWHDAAVVCRQARQKRGQAPGAPSCAPSIGRFR